MKLIKSLNARGSSQLIETIKFELEEQPIDALPLQKGLSHTSYVLNESFNVVVIFSSGSSDTIGVEWRFF